MAGPVDSSQRRYFFAVFAIGCVVLSSACSRGGGSDSTAAVSSSAALTPSSAPDFEFKVKKINVTSSEPGAKPIVKPTQQDQHAVEEIAKQLSLLYAAAFLDPATWTTGDFGPVYDSFAPGARQAAKLDESTLTAGPEAGSVYESIEATHGTVSTRVLSSENGAVITAAAKVGFHAQATTSAGGSIELVSKGTYFLSQSGGKWLVYAFDVSRSDSDVKAPEGVSTRPGSSAGSAP